jgi:SAM-dependent methyltransferase
MSYTSESNGSVLKARFPHIFTYPSRRRLERQWHAYLQQLQSKSVLDYGCGRGDLSLKMLAEGAERVCGIDISRVYIDDAIARAGGAGFEPQRFDFRVMDAHALEYEDCQFDLVVGSGILHHLDPDVALSEIYRVLKPEGRVLLFEPLADNPLLKVFRRLTPNARTRDERPFTGKEVRRFVALNDWRAELIYCGLLEAPAACLTSLVVPNHPENWLLRSVDVLERTAHRLNVLPSWNQYLLFNMVKN